MMKETEGGDGKMMCEWVSTEFVGEIEIFFLSGGPKTVQNVEESARRRSWKVCCLNDFLYEL